MKTFIALAAATATVLGTAAYAQDFKMPVQARQGQFAVLAINLGILGGMARGATEYDAEAAQAAADSIVAVTMINQGPLWPEGSDSMSIDGTRAEPAIWENLPDVLSKFGDLTMAAQELQAVAGTGQEAIGPALGKLGGTCKACHDNYRTPE
ncbi:cytochrome c [Cognatishimia sp. F0-27]|uniref:c-type cytochrome n=1 Tax=Cognatishimia sp. F0-27 TaxID=2816855 RepID=UPI001D0C8131|nr:cytochrome c [Cognatishimia sp. F0-27]MCC1492563.1 cytochrome c [Cognatishimia sp. F0-27]